MAYPHKMELAAATLRMSENEFLLVQESLMWVFSPVLGWWFVGVSVGGVSMAIIMLWLGFLRRITSKEGPGY